MPMTIFNRAPPIVRLRMRLATVSSLAAAAFASTALPALLVTQLAACSSTDKVKPAVVQPVLQRSGQKSLTIRADNTGSSVILDPTQELIVELDNPTTTNFEWSVVDLKPGVVSVTSSKFERALRNLSAEESGGSTVFHLKAEAPGSVDLKFDLRKPRSLDPAVQTVTYAVTVR
jgi:Chagasin family peptidase inhibitor I42